MPKRLHEITRFASGIIATPDERDIPDDSAVSSTNVNPIGKAGKLEPMPDDEVYIAGGTTFGSNTGITGGDETSPMMSVLNNAGPSDGDKALIWYNKTKKFVTLAKNIADGSFGGIDRTSHLGSSTASSFTATGQVYSQDADKVSLLSEGNRVHLSLGRQTEDGDVTPPQIIQNNSSDTFGFPGGGVTMEPAEVAAPDHYGDYFKIIASSDATKIFGMVWNGSQVHKLDASNGNLICKSGKNFGYIRSICIDAIAPNEYIYVIGGTTNKKDGSSQLNWYKLRQGNLSIKYSGRICFPIDGDGHEKSDNLIDISTSNDSDVDKGFWSTKQNTGDNEDASYPPSASSSNSYGDQATLLNPDQPTLSGDHVLSARRMSTTAEDTRKAIYHGWMCTDMIVCQNYAEKKTADNSELQAAADKGTYIYFVNGDRAVFPEQHISSDGVNYGENGGEQEYRHLDGTTLAHNYHQNEWCFNGVWFWRFAVRASSGNVSAYSRTPSVEFSRAPQWSADSDGQAADDYSSNDDAFLAKGNAGSYGVLHPRGAFQDLGSGNSASTAAVSDGSGGFNQVDYTAMTIYNSTCNMFSGGQTSGPSNPGMHNNCMFGIVSAAIGQGPLYSPPKVMVSVPKLCLFTTSTSASIPNNAYNISAVGIMTNISDSVGPTHINEWVAFTKNLSLANTAAQEPDFDDDWGSVSPPNITNDIRLFGYGTERANVTLVDSGGSGDVARPFAILSPVCLREQDATRITRASSANANAIGITYRIGACTDMVYTKDSGTHNIAIPGGTQGIIYPGEHSIIAQDVSEQPGGAYTSRNRVVGGHSFYKFARGNTHGFIKLTEYCTGISGGVKVADHPSSDLTGMQKATSATNVSGAHDEYSINFNDPASDHTPTIKYGDQWANNDEYMFHRAAELILNDVSLFKVGDIISRGSPAMSSNNERLFIFNIKPEQNKLWVYRCYGAGEESDHWNVGDFIYLYTGPSHLLNYEYREITEWENPSYLFLGGDAENSFTASHVNMAHIDGASRSYPHVGTKTYSQGYSITNDNSKAIGIITTQQAPYFEDADDGSESAVHQIITAPIYYGVCVWNSGTSTGQQQYYIDTDRVDSGTGAYTTWGSTATGDDDWFSGWNFAHYRRNAAGGGMLSGDKGADPDSKFVPGKMQLFEWPYQTIVLPGQRHETRQNTDTSNGILLLTPAQRGTDIVTSSLSDPTVGAIQGSITIYRYHSEILATGVTDAPSLIWINGSGGELRKWLWDKNITVDNSFDTGDTGYARLINMLPADTSVNVGDNPQTITVPTNWDKGRFVGSGYFDMHLYQQKSSTGTSKFQSNYRYYYKATFIYDNIEESPLTEKIYKSPIQSRGTGVTAVFTDGFGGDNDLPAESLVSSISALEMHDRHLFSYRSIRESWIGTSNRSIMLWIKFQNMPDVNKRITHLRIYRAERPGSFQDVIDSPPASAYRLVKEFDLRNETRYIRTPENAADGLTVGGDNVQLVYEDRGDSFASYTASTGFPETMHSFTPAYNVATIGEGYKFIADISNPGLKNVSEFIFRSKPLKNNVFDWSQDYTICPETPVALKTFNGKLFAFSESKTFRFNLSNLALEDEYDMAGCKGPTNVITTEFGMFYADAQNVYMSSGQGIRKISDAISSGEDIVGWQEIDHSTVKTFMVPDVKRTSVLIFGGDYIYSYNVPQERWDIWRLSESSVTNATSITSASLDNKGNLIVFDSAGAAIKMNSHSSNVKPLTWISRRETIGLNTQDKIWRKIKVMYDGATAPTVQYSVDNGSNWRNGTQTSGNGMVELKVDSAYKKAKDVQVKVNSAANQNPEITSIGIVYRSRPVK